MRPFPSLLILVLSLATACDDSFPTAPQVILPGDPGAPGPVASESLVGVLQITEEPPAPSLRGRFGRSGLLWPTTLQ